LSLLPFKSERSVKKLIEGLQFYRDKLHEKDVYERFSEILSKARSNKSANKPDTELNEFESVRMLPDHLGMWFSQSCRSWMNTDVKAQKTKPLRSALKASKQRRNGKPRDDVGLFIYARRFLLTLFAAARKKVAEPEPEPRPEPESQNLATQEDDDDMYL